MHQSLNVCLAFEEVVSLLYVCIASCMKIPQDNVVLGLKGLIMSAIKAATPSFGLETIT